MSQVKSLTRICCTMKTVRTQKPDYRARPVQLLCTNKKTLIKFKDCSIVAEIIWIHILINDIQHNIWDIKYGQK